MSRRLGVRRLIVAGTTTYVLAGLITALVAGERAANAAYALYEHGDEAPVELHNIAVIAKSTQSDAIITTLANWAVIYALAWIVFLIFRWIWRGFKAAA